MTTASQSVELRQEEQRSDGHILERVAGGDTDAFALLMRRHNRRLFRTVRSIVADDAEAEDVCQEAWITAYRCLAQLEDPNAFSGWLMRIGLRSALHRRRRSRWFESLDELDAIESSTDTVGPENDIDRQALARMLEQAIDGLPPSYRLVVMLRDIEHMSTAEAADVLGLKEENVRVRLHRARAALRSQISELFGDAVNDAFRFDGHRCERLAAAVLPQLRALAFAASRVPGGSVL